MGRFFSVTMKVEICHFSGFRIHPGHGKKIVKNDSKQYWIINKKIEKHFWDKKNPRKVPWTWFTERFIRKDLLKNLKEREPENNKKLLVLLLVLLLIDHKEKNYEARTKKICSRSSFEKAKEEKKKTQQEKRKTNQPRQKDNRAKNQKCGKG